VSRLRFGGLQLALGTGLLGCAAVLGGGAWLLVWPAVSVAVVGLGYLGLGPGIFGKRPDGSLRAPHFALLLPYHAVAWLRMNADGWLRREPPWHEVAPGLFLGRQVPARALPPATRIVVDLTAELPAPAGLADGREYHCLPALDTSVPRYEEFAALARRIAGEPAAVYVHCAAGRGRSATFAAAVLLARGLAQSPAEAESRLRAARPGVRLHAAQRALLARFEEALAPTARGVSD